MTLDLLSGAAIGVIPERIWRFLKLAAIGIWREMTHDTAHRVLTAPRLFYELTTANVEDESSPPMELFFAVAAATIGFWMFLSAGDWSLIVQARAQALLEAGFPRQAAETYKLAAHYLFLAKWSPLLILSGIITHTGFFYGSVLCRKAGAFCRIVSWPVASYIFFLSPQHRLLGWLLLVFFLFSMLCYLRLSRLPTWRNGGDR